MLQIDEQRALDQCHYSLHVGNPFCAGWSSIRQRFRWKFLWETVCFDLSDYQTVLLHFLQLL